MIEIQFLKKTWCHHLYRVINLHVYTNLVNHNYVACLNEHLYKVNN